MLRDFFGNIPPVIKNLLLINVLLFVGTVMSGPTEYAAYKWHDILGMHYFMQEDFRPYQIVSHFFMHADVPHLLFNMLGLIMVGSVLERVWGAKKILVFYIVCALGATVIHQASLAFNIYSELGVLDIKQYSGSRQDLTESEVQKIASSYYSISMGASGAIYGLLVAFAVLFPNTEFMMLFFPVPIKAKYFVPLLIILGLFMSNRNFQGDNVAHFAHLGGAIFGFILVKLWQRDRNNFY